MPGGRCGVAAARLLRSSGWIREEETVVVLNTGSGVKYSNTVQAAPPVLQPGERLTGREESWLRQDDHAGGQKRKAST
ncbi:hypothetical protein YDYSG_68870 [Paenibacillus tyrfis]|nr:hypothetical protein YDYSG_68870 [Paenibacillus tyrfis]